MQILYEDNHLIFVNKPAGLLAQGDITGDANVVDLLKAHRKKAESKPGEAFVGLVHRLDRPVSGVMVLAKTSKAAQRLAAAWHTAGVEKTYRAVVRNGPGLPTQEYTQWIDTLVKDERTNLVRVVRSGVDAENARRAEMFIRTVSENKDYAEVELKLGTGRGHQIRVQLAHRGLPIVGDQKYGSQERYVDETGHPRVALHAWQLTVPHPTLKKRLCVTASFPGNWPIRGAGNTWPAVEWLDEPAGIEPD